MHLSGGGCALRAATLVTAVLVCTKFYQVNKLAGYLLYPYVAFLLFANALNISIATKNQNVRKRRAGFCPTFQSLLAFRPCYCALRRAGAAYSTVEKRCGLEYCSIVTRSACVP